MDDVVKVRDCFLGKQSSAGNDELEDDAGLFVWGTEGDGSVDIKTLSVEPARNEGPFCLVT